MPNQPKTPNRNIRIPDELWAALQARAADEGVSVSDVVRDILGRVMLPPQPERQPTDR